MGRDEVQVQEAEIQGHPVAAFGPRAASEFAATVQESFEGRIVASAERNDDSVLTLVFNNKRTLVLSAQTGAVGAALPSGFLPFVEVPTILRENLHGLWLARAEALPGEPIVKMAFKGVFDRTLVFEGLKRSSNILLLDEEGRVIWAIRTFGGETRKGLPMESWQPPPEAPGTPPADESRFDNEAFFSAVHRHLLEKAKAREARSISSRIKSLEKKRAALSAEAEEAAAWIAGEAAGKSLLAVPDLKRRGLDRVSVPDYSQSPPAEISIALDPRLTVHENAHRFFKLSKKGKERLRILPGRLDEIDGATSALREKAAAVASIERLEELKGGRPADRKKEEKKASSRLPKGVVALDLPGSFKGYAGKNARGNDQVSFRIAKGEDFWFHAADYRGAHVVVRNPSRLEELPPETEKAAARYAAEHSSAPPGNAIEVMVTKAKFLAPVKGAPGSVYVSRSRKRLIDLGEN